MDAQHNDCFLHTEGTEAGRDVIGGAAALVHLREITWPIYFPLALNRTFSWQFWEVSCWL